MNSRARIGVGLGTLALIAALAACGAAPATSTTGSANAAAPVSTAVAASAGSASTQVAAATGGNAGTPRPRGTGQFAPGAAGVVQSINGSTITLQNPRGSGPTTIQLTGSTTIRKQVVGAIADLKSGDVVTVLGQQNGNVIQARQIQVGLNQGGLAGGGQSRQGGGNGSSGGRQGGNGGFVRGTVTSVAGDTVTIQETGGSTVQVQLASGGQVLETVAAQLSDIKPGDTLVAVGQNQGNALVASTVNLTNGLPGGNNGQNPSPTQNPAA